MTKAIQRPSLLPVGTSVQSGRALVRRLFAAPAVGYTHAIDAVRGTFAVAMEQA